MVKKKIYNCRIDNIEFRKSIPIRQDDSEYYEIVKWVKNPYYGRENEYNVTTEGVIEGKSYYKDSIHCLIHESCFKNPESCYTLAIFFNPNTETTELKYVLDRPIRLNEDEQEIFHSLVKYGYDKLMIQETNFEDEEE